uniref:Uncharacterized protein n=1 Tax=Romanomermis culicivorax TaxID=13658 RepID=A0A915IGQ6_ROMCU
MQSRKRNQTEGKFSFRSVRLEIIVGYFLENCSFKLLESCSVPSRKAKSVLFASAASFFYTKVVKPSPFLLFASQTRVVPHYSLSTTQPPLIIIFVSSSPRNLCPFTTVHF